MVISLTEKWDVKSRVAMFFHECKNLQRDFDSPFLSRGQKIFETNYLFSNNFRDVQVGDVATVGECRPLSKTVKFNTLKVPRAAGNKKSFKKF